MAVVGHKTSFKFEEIILAPPPPPPPSSSNDKKRPKAEKRIKKTNWLMHEYTVRSRGKDDWALCKIYELRRGVANQEEGEEGQGLAVPLEEPPSSHAHTTPLTPSLADAAREPDTPLLICSEAQQTDSFDEGGRLHPAKRKRVDRPQPPGEAFDNPIVLAENVASPSLPHLPSCDQQDWDWDPMLYIDFDTDTLEPASPLPVAASCEDAPLLSCPGAPQGAVREDEDEDEDEDGGPDPAKGMRAEHPGQQQPQGSMAAGHDNAAVQPWSLSDVLTPELMDALPTLSPPPSHDPLYVDAWIASLRCGDAPPGLLPSPPLDAVALPPSPSPSPPPMTADHPTPHCPASAQPYCQPFEHYSDTSPLLHQHALSTVPSPIYYHF